jgi:hypothetical protein
MPGSFLPVIDARPSRESQHFSIFRRQGFWRLLARNNAASQGGVAGKGFLVPTNIADHLSGGMAMEDVTSTLVSMGAITTPGSTLMSNYPIYFPQNGVGLTVPVQTVAATITFAIGYLYSGTTTTQNIQTVTLELVKISNAGVVTSIATQTVTPNSAYSSGSASTFQAFQYQFNLTVGSLVTLAATDRLAVRLSVTGYTTAGGSNSSLILNGASGTYSAAIPFAPSATIGSFVALEVY